MIFFLYSLFVLSLAALPTILFLKNLNIFLPATKEEKWLEEARKQKLSVLIPARNEAESIGPAIESILANTHPDFHLYVLDDASEDNTAAIVEQKGITDSRVTLLNSEPLGAGWNGKQHACWQLACNTERPWLLFLDADVRLTSDALERIVAEALRIDAPLLSGFPYQETGTFAEKLLIPMMHFVLLGYLPIRTMRSNSDPKFSAGCGQLFLSQRDAYFKVGGHQAIKSSRHDGIKLPKAFRLAGFKTDLFDASDIATCRMYQSLPQVLVGLLKNANEGIANKYLIVPFTVLLGGAAILPIPSLFYAIWHHQSLLAISLLFIATCLVFVPRYLAAVRFRQSGLGVLLHPLSVLWFLQIQWQAFFGSIMGVRVTWRGRN